MGKRRPTAVLAMLAGGAIGLPYAAAQESADAVTVEVAQCAELESDAARIACFGEQVDAAIRARGAVEPDGAAVAEDVTEAAGHETSSARTPGASAAAEPAAVEARPVETPRGTGAEESEYLGTVVALRERVPNSYLITLDNGQIWQQVEPKRYLLKPGLQVRIYSTRWGHRLTAVDSGGHIQIRRVR